MSRRRKSFIAIVSVLILAGLAVALLDPNRRLLGWINGEPFFKGRAASAWMTALDQPERPDFAEAYEALIAAKAEAVPTCRWILKQKTRELARRRAADILRLMGKDAAPAAPELVAALSDPDPLVRGVAIRAVGELHPDTPGAVAGLVNLFPDVNAIRAVSNFGPLGAEAVPALAALLNHDDAKVRWQAVRTLGKIREPALQVLDELIRLTGSDPDAEVREHAAEAIGDIGPAAAKGIPALVKALKDPSPKVRRDAVRSLGQMGPAAKEALPEVIAAMNDQDSNVKKAATDAARFIDPSRATQK